MLLEPALRIIVVVQRDGLFGEFKRVLGIEHNRELLGASCLLAGHDRTRMRAVRNTARMQRDGTSLDTAARTEISAHVKEHFVGFNVVVHPRNLYRFRMIIEHPRRKCADYIPPDFKRLMNRRRLMNCTGDRFKISGVEREWVDKAIPPHHVEWMMSHNHS